MARGEEVGTKAGESVPRRGRIGSTTRENELNVTM
jgi:hypothetical protein